MKQTLVEQEEWKFKCRRCRKEWIIQSKMDRYILATHYDMQGAKIGEVHKTICTKCQTKTR